MLTTFTPRLMRFLVGMLVTLSAGVAYGQTTASTYQRQLSVAGALADGSFDVHFALFDSLVSGAQIGANQTVPAVPVSDGVFTVQPVDELIRGVNNLLGTALLDVCPSFDESGNGRVTVDEIVAAANRTLKGC